MRHKSISALPLAILLATTVAIPGFAADPIKVGVDTPITGTYAPIGQQVRWGLDLATKEVNAAGGVMGRQIELIYEDEEANPAVAVQKADKLFQVDKVEFLTGTVNSGSTLAVGQTAERAGKLIATTVSFADFDYGRQMFAQCVSGQCTRRAAIGGACGVARQG